ncbi:MAG: U32 family peptidase [Xenococcaceae cyanobacterium MO_188.B32]|nr:U32 family peptidase [Xenococcaceae cyanobacterium MO_188.B32]
MFDLTRQYLQKLGLPGEDKNNLPSSKLTFTDGANFRIEIPTVNTLEAARALLQEAELLGITINRLTETYGIFRHTRREIQDWVNLCRDYGCQLVMSPGPRATYDTSATVQSSQGVRIGYRLRGQEQVIRAIEDVKRGVELGIKGFLIYDEGMLWLVARMRQDGELPPDISFKVSAHCGNANPVSVRLMAEFGADSVNPVRDLQLPMIAAIREAVSIPLDCHTDNPPASGGFIRSYEAPEIVRIAAPVYLKTGNSVISSHGQLTSVDDGKQMARQASIIVEMVERYYPEAIQSPRQINFETDWSTSNLKLAQQVKG